MKLVVGLGNPGAKYRETLHNVGFAVVDALAESLSNGVWGDKFNGLLLQDRIGRYAFLLLKPQTYMNSSGVSVRACQQFYKLELPDILVISDDVDRPAGSLRYRMSGGHGGHNGLRDIIRQCGGNDFHRIKIGIGRPVGGGDIAHYVLSKPPLDIRLSVNEAIAATNRYVADFISGRPIRIETEPRREPESAGDAVN